MNPVTKQRSHSDPATPGTVNFNCPIVGSGSTTLGGAGKRSRKGGKRIWRKQRHTDTVGCDVVGYTGPASRPARLAVRLPNGHRVLTQPLAPPLAADVARDIADAVPGRHARTEDGERYTIIAGPVVEVEAGTTRHATAYVTRIR